MKKREAGPVEEGRQGDGENLVPREEASLRGMRRSSALRRPCLNRRTGAALTF